MEGKGIQQPKIYNTEKKNIIISSSLKKKQWNVYISGKNNLSLKTKRSFIHAYLKHRYFTIII